MVQPDRCAYDEDCPFCGISRAYPASDGTVTPSDIPNDVKSPAVYALLSTPHVLAFLDHAPISRGHVLVTVRQHRVKISDVTVQEGRALGAWLGVLSRVVVGAVDTGTGTGSNAGALKEDVGDWNLVQNNGARAAQVVPHVHFHIIPRSGDVPDIKARSWTIFGRGQRQDLDDEDAVVLVQQMRKRLAEELERVKAREGEDALNILLGSSDPKQRAIKL